MKHCNYLNTESLPIYLSSSYRQFYSGETHVTRTCEYHVLLLVLSGTLCFSENTIPIKVCEGEYYIQKKGLYQQGILPCYQPFYFYIHFDGQISDRSSALPDRGTFHKEQLKPLFDQMERCEKPEQRSQLKTAALFYSILSALEQSCFSNVSDSNAPDSIAMQTAAYLTQHFQEPIRLDQLSVQLNYSKDHLIRIFKKQYGTTPYRYLTELRIHHAQQLLLSTNRSITQIAAECGYPDTSVFYRAFLSSQGCNPRDFRTRSLGLGSKECKQF